LVVSVFVSLMVSRNTVFYNAQRSRVDIMALPGALCEPGKEGMPMVMEYEESGTYDDSYDGNNFSDDDMDSPQEVTFTADQQVGAQVAPVADTGKNETMNKADAKTLIASFAPQRGRELSSSESTNRRGRSPLPPRPTDKRSGGGELSLSGNKADPSDFGGLSSSRLDELLAAPIEGTGKGDGSHRRIHSAPDLEKKLDKGGPGTSGSDRSVGHGSTGGNSRHVRGDSLGTSYRRVVTKGQLSVDQPDLMDQARQMSATSVMAESRNFRYPSIPSRSPRGHGHSRGDSLPSLGADSTGFALPVAAEKHSISASDVERTFASALNQDMVGNRNRAAHGTSQE
jgi:hypothetical protein